MSIRQGAILNLRAAAAIAAKLADDLENNRLWEGEFNEALAQLQKAVRDVPSIR